MGEAPVHIKQNRFLIVLVVPAIFAGVIGYLVYLELAHEKRLSQEEEQLEDAVGPRQTSELRIEEEVGQGEGDIQPGEETVALGPSEEPGLSPEKGSNAQQSLKSIADAQPAQSIEVPIPQSRTTQDKARVPEASPRLEVRELPPEVLPKSIEADRQSPAIAEDKPERENPPEVRRSAITLGVENREPKGVCERVSVHQGVYCWVHVINGEGRKIIVRWITKGKKLWETRLSVGSDNWRTWAYITLRPSMIGPAQADILDDDGELLQSLSFEITG